VERPAPFRHRVDVRYLEVDQQGVVFNMWYLAYFDDALTAFLAAGGLPYDRLLAGGTDLQLVRTEIDWSAPLRFGEPAWVEVTVTRAGRTSFTLGFTAGAGDRTAARGGAVYVAVDGDGRPRPLPDELRRSLGSLPSV
jgi:acyl-CoA thioester hydrolase